MNHTLRRLIPFALLAVTPVSALAATTSLQCSWDAGFGTFQFTINPDAKTVTVGRYSNIPAAITPQTIVFKYYMGQLVGRTDTPEYDVTFDRASNVYSYHTPPGYTNAGKAWGPGGGTATCK